jgi:hypothetical protein
MNGACRIKELDIYTFSLMENLRGNIKVITSRTVDL